jgi:hypothetical protein
MHLPFLKTTTWFRIKMGIRRVTIPSPSHHLPVLARSNPTYLQVPNAITGTYTMKGGKFLYDPNSLLVSYDDTQSQCQSGPLEQPKCTPSPSEYAAAIEEFKNGGYRDSDEDEDEDEIEGQGEGEGGDA